MGAPCGINQDLMIGALKQNRPWINNMLPKISHLPSCPLSIIKYTEKFSLVTISVCEATLLVNELKSK